MNTSCKSFLVSLYKSGVTEAFVGFSSFVDLVLSPCLFIMFSSGLICKVACFDEGAARFTQKRLRLGTAEETHLAMTAALDDLGVLCRDHYGNFMLQGLFEFGSNEMKTDLMDAIYKYDVVALCMHMHG